MNVKNTFFTILMSLNAGSAALAYPGAGPGSQLDFSARDLTNSVQNLVYIMNFIASNSDPYRDAVTLSYAASHFQEEVELGPQDLDVDFNTIEQTFDELKQHFMSCGEFTRFEQMRSAWFRVEESNLRLRQSWIGGDDQGSNRGDGGGRGRGDGDNRGGWGRGDSNSSGGWGRGDSNSSGGWGRGDGNNRGGWGGLGSDDHGGWHR